MLLDDAEILERERDLDSLRHAHALLKTNFEQAQRDLEKLASQGSAMAMLYLGYAFEEQGVSGFQRAKTWYNHAYQNNSSSALLRLARMAYQSGDKAGAKELWAEGVAKNDAPSMYYLASVYLEEPSIADYGKVRNLLERASALGQLRARAKLSRMLMLGQYGLTEVPKGILLAVNVLISGVKIAYRNPSDRRLW